MAGETLVRACFGRGLRCRICGESVGHRSGARLHHAARHLQRLTYSGLLARDQVHTRTKGKPDR